jgi:prolyl oligopeptidase
MRTTRWAAALAVSALAAVLMTSVAQESKLKYPETKKGDVVDDYHGTRVADPYR